MAIELAGHVLLGRSHKDACFTCDVVGCPALCGFAPVAGHALGLDGGVGDNVLSREITFGRPGEGWQMRETAAERAASLRPSALSCLPRDD